MRLEGVYVAPSLAIATHQRRTRIRGFTGRTGARWARPQSAFQHPSGVPADGDTEDVAAEAARPMRRERLSRATTAIPAFGSTIAP